MRKFLFGIGLSLYLIVPGWAGTIYVPGNQATIQGGIDAAENGDTVLLTNDTYSGAGNYDINFSGKSLIVRSENGPDNCIIDCLQLGRGFLAYNNEESVTLEGLTIKNAASGAGAGVYASCQGLILKNCILVENTASASGGAVFSAGSATITNCSFKDNHANSGGAVSVSGPSSITNCTFIGNSVTGGGGAVGISACSTVTNCLFAGNSAAKGGAVYSNAVNANLCSSSFINCTFSTNSASEQGGALWCYISLDPTNHIYLKNCILWGDSAPESAEIFISDNPVTITYSDIQGGHLGEGVIDIDPLFVNAAGDDLHLQNSSPCIDSGTEDGAPVDDLEGYLRPVGSGYDMGSYEFHYEIFVWEGTTVDWDNPNNWNYPDIPNELQTVFVVDASVDPEIKIEDAKAAKLVIESGGLTIQMGKLSVGETG